MRRRRVRGLVSIGVAVAVGGCALLSPLPDESTVEDRLAALPKDNLPLEQDVAIHWNAHQVPFIVAQTDGDAAFALGLVHAHLRLGQMELMRHISQGRLSEMVGPFAVDIDHSLRILNFGRASEEIEAALPEETRLWLERFVAGINHYQAELTEKPYEFAALGLEREPWKIRDLITIGRLAASDVNWFVWFRVWKLRQRPDWPELWAELVRDGSNSMTSFVRAEGEPDLAMLTDLLGDYSRSGSNSFAVAPGRTASGHALIANDPHLGFVLPNLWLIGGIKSPSYHAVGLMVPGLPFVAVGRNPWVAWGGTNMRAASSDMFDVSSLPPSEITERTEQIGVRWWFDDEVNVRETPLGPIISDAPLLESGDGEAIALRWMGHTVTDEFTAMLRVNRARNWQEFRDAFRTFAVSAQNMLYADVEGNIGQVMAVRLPTRPNDHVLPLILAPDDGEAPWHEIVGVESLPAQLNPERGFLASANNRPAETVVPIGFFFSPDDRIARISELLAANGRVGLDEARAIQTDVFEPTAFALNQAVLAAIERVDAAKGSSPEAGKVLALMRAWDGRYAVDSQGPVAFEAVLANLLPALYESRFPDGSLASFVGVADLGRVLPQDIDGADPDELRQKLSAALEAAADVVEEFPSWGDMHRMALGHPLRLLPVIGSKFEFAEFPSGGSRQTVMKTNSANTAERHRASYGSQARHVSDMGDLDENYFVLLGGQDGWFGSDTFIDQVALWRAGDYIRMPLREETVRAEFAYETVLKRK